MLDESLLSDESADAVDDSIAELTRMVRSLRGAGMSRRGISELLDVHEAQIRDFLDQARHTSATGMKTPSHRAIGRAVATVEA